MAQFWLVREPGGPVEGPMSADELRSLFARGAITSRSLISDGAEWFAADRVKGLSAASSVESSLPPRAVDHGSEEEFDPYGLEEMSAASASAQSSLAGQSESPVAAPPVAVPPMMQTAIETGPSGKRRNLVWYLVLAIILFVFSASANVVSEFDGSPDPFEVGFAEVWSEDAWYISDWLFCISVPLWFGLWIYWLVWVYQVHNEVANYTRGRHNVSPGLALGLSFVPLLNLFWKSYISYRLAETVSHEGHVTCGRFVVSPGTVLTMQILSVVPGCCLGLSAVFTAIAMLLMQRGLNALWSAVPAVQRFQPIS